MSKTYDHDKLIEDQEVGIRGLYQDNGYFKVSLPDPILENVDTEGWKYGIPFAGRTTGKAVNITIPIEEGERYTMGSIKIVSSDPDKALSLKVDALKSVFPLKPGDVFSDREDPQSHGRLHQDLWPVRLHRFRSRAAKRISTRRPSAST